MTEIDALRARPGPVRRLKCCPRKVCASMDVRLVTENVEDQRGREHARSRVVCRACGCTGPWGNAPGDHGAHLAIAGWNTKWGRRDDDQGS